MGARSIENTKDSIRNTFSLRMKSLDPRVNRLPEVGQVGTINPKAPLDQLGTFEIFVEPKEGKPFQHEGALHAPNLEMAYILAKETFTRRFTCSSIFVVDTRDVGVSPMTDGMQNAYDLIASIARGNTETTWEIFHLTKRGKQHVHVGQVKGATPQEAMSAAKEKFGHEKMVYNVWAVLSRNIRFTKPEDKEIWNTLPEKKFRDAANYKGGDKLKDFLAKQQAQ